MGRVRIPVCQTNAPEHVLAHGGWSETLPSKEGTIDVDWKDAARGAAPSPCCTCCKTCLLALHLGMHEGPAEPLPQLFRFGRADVVAICWPHSPGSHDYQWRVVAEQRRPWTLPIITQGPRLGSKIFAYANWLLTAVAKRISRPCRRPSLLRHGDSSSLLLCILDCGSFVRPISRKEGQGLDSAVTESEGYAVA